MTTGLTLSSTSPFQKNLDSPLTPYVQQIKWYFLGMKSFCVLSNLDSLLDAVQFIANYTRVHSVDSLTAGIMHVMESVCCHCQFVVYLNLELLVRRVVLIFFTSGSSRSEESNDGVSQLPVSCDYARVYRVS